MVVVACMGMDACPRGGKDGCPLPRRRVQWRDKNDVSAEFWGICRLPRAHLHHSPWPGPAQPGLVRFALTPRMITLARADRDDSAGQYNVKANIKVESHTGGRGCVVGGFLAPVEIFLFSFIISTILLCLFVKKE